MRIVKAAAVGVGLLVAGAAPAAAAPTITEVAGFSSPATGIAAGPDGAIWVTERAWPGRVARVAPGGAVTEFTAGITPGFTKARQPTSMTVGPDGALWFVERGGAGFVGRITVNGVVSEFGGLTRGIPTSIAAGPDGNLWVTENAVDAEDDAGGAIARISPDGHVTEFSAGLDDGADPNFITAGPDGALWFTDLAVPARIGRITTDGAITERSAGLSASGAPAGIAAGPDGALWFAAPGRRGAIGRVPAVGRITELSAGLTPEIRPRAIAAGPDGALWFTANDAIGRITTDGAITEYRDGLTPGPAGTGIVAGPDGAMWFTEAGGPRIGRITVPPLVLPATGEAQGARTARITGAVRPNGSPTTYNLEVRRGRKLIFTSPDFGAGAGIGDVPVVFTLRRLKPSTSYTARVVAANDAGTAVGAEARFTTQAAPAPAPAPTPDPAPDPGPAAAPVPVAGESVVLRADRGTVKVKAPGQDGFTPLTSASTVPVGALVDTRRGEIRLTSALRRGRTQVGHFRGGLFRVRQSAKHHGRTDLVLRGRLSCGTTMASASGAKRKKHRSRRLWGRDKGGHFSTHGRDSVTTVRGTEWLTVDRCGGTLVRVRHGAVAVRDRGARRAVLVRAGGRHFTPHR